MAVVDGVCAKDQVLFEATLHDANDSKIPLGFARSSAGGIIGNKRINDDSSFATNFPLDKWNNRIVVSRQSFRQDDPEVSRHDMEGVSRNRNVARYFVH